MINNRVPEGSYDTAKEISGQPALWQDTYTVIASKHQELSSFLTQTLVFSNLRILLVGAGTSAYIGEVLEKYVRQKTHKVAEAVASTDFISHPKHFLTDPGQPILMISFARSGNSNAFSRI